MQLVKESFVVVQDGDDALLGADAHAQVLREGAEVPEALVLVLVVVLAHIAQQLVGSLEDDQQDDAEL